jgi:O-antigen ligase
VNIAFLTAERRRGLPWLDAWWFVGVGVAVLLGLVASQGSPLGGLALLGLGFALLGVIYPPVMLLAVMTSIFMDGLGTLSTSVLLVPVTLSKMVFVFALFLWVIRAVLWKQPLLVWTPLSLPMVGVLISMVVSLLSWTAGYYALDGYRDVMSVLMLTVLLHYVVAVLDKDWLRPTQRVYALLVGLLLVGSVTSGIGMERASGSFGNPNNFAFVLLLTVPTSIGIVLGERRSAWRSALLLIFMGAFVLGIVQSASRAGLLAFLVSTPFLLWLLYRDFTVLLVGAGIALVLAPFVMDVSFVLDRYRALWEVQPHTAQALGVTSIESRFLFVSLALELFAEHPLTGVGVGGFIAESAQYFPLGGGRDAHNSYAQVMAEQGMVGLVTHGFLAVMLVSFLLRALRDVKDPVQRVALKGHVVGFIGYAVMSVSIGKLMIYAVGYLSVGLALAVARLGSDTSADSSEEDGHATPGEDALEGWSRG